MGYNNSRRPYTPLEVFTIRYANFYWKFIDYLAFGMDKIATLYENGISKAYEKETNLFDTLKSKNIIHIGCGAYPASAITLAKMNCKNIVAIDRNARAVKLANKIIYKKKLNNIITVKKGDGRNYPIEQFDTIIVSSVIFPKIDVLKHIFKTARPNSKIIIRELSEVSDFVVDFIKSNKNIKLIKRIGNNSHSDYNWDSFYTIKL